MIQIEKLKKTIKTVYEEPLPRSIHYHKWSHIQQVEEAAVKIADGESVIGDDLIRLKSGVYIHDIGNLISREKHEQRSMDISSPILSLFGASEKDIEVIRGLVLSTAIPQKPKNILEGIMCDSDLSLMGYENWLEVIDGYRLELRIDNLQKWYSGQISFLETHRWFTKTAARLYDEPKHRNIDLVRSKLFN